MSAINIQGWNVNAPTSTSGSPPIPSSTAPSTAPPTSNNSGLSTGAKAGIGVSAAIGGLGWLAFAAAFFMLKRRPKEVKYNSVPAEGPRPGAQPPVTTVHELQASQKPQELTPYSSPVGTHIS